MVDQEKVILMSRLASYEQNEGKKYIAICRYYRGDYIGWQVLKSIIASTIAFLVIVALWGVCAFEEIMVGIYKTDLVAFGKQVLVYYVAFVGSMGFLTYLIYAYRYNQARRSLRVYYHNLKKLEH